MHAACRAGRANYTLDGYAYGRGQDLGGAIARKQDLGFDELVAVDDSGFLFAWTTTNLMFGSQGWGNLRVDQDQVSFSF